MSWIKFLRQYGPIARNDNMYDETIQRAARRKGIKPIIFEHPKQAEILACFTGAADIVSVILTGTAGDGKTHLCRQVWKALKGRDEDWESDNPHLTIQREYSSEVAGQPSPSEPPKQRLLTINFIRDLSGFAPPQGAAWEPEKEEVLQRFCRSLFNPQSSDIFLIAANDGQLVESWRRLKQTEAVIQAGSLFENLLVEDRQEVAGTRLKFFNLSRTNSAELFDRASEAFLSHPGWSEFESETPNEAEAFGPSCPIRHNYELLKTSLVRSRLRSLLELCDYNGLHVPIRQILLLLTNSILGHPDVKDYLMVPADVPKIIASGTVSKASLYNNIFGGNLPENRRQAITIFDCLEHFQIGYETSNRTDNILIFGEAHEYLGDYFEEFIAKDKFYGADQLFYAAKRQYVEGSDDEGSQAADFLLMLVSQRRGLFFKIAEDQAQELSLWELTVFKFAGEYLNDIVNVLKRGMEVKRTIVSRLVKGLNRVFTGMLMNSERELYLATSGNHSQAKVSRVLIEQVSVEPSKGEKITIKRDQSNGKIILGVYLAPALAVDFDLTLIRYEFLSRIALEGALPASFSKECYEDLLSFKSRLIAKQAARQEAMTSTTGESIYLRLLSLTERGLPEPQTVEVMP